MTTATTLPSRPMTEGARNLFASRRNPMSILRLADLAAAPCPDCRSDLNIHQPEPDQPDRLLGTCPACGLWSLIVVDEAHDQATLHALADPAPPLASESA
jgi:hypothetical protein